MSLQAILERCYAAEVNVTLSSFWDDGWCISIGDDINGFKARMYSKSLDDAAIWLAPYLGA